MSNLNNLAQKSREEFQPVNDLNKLAREIVKDGYYSDKANLYYGLGEVPPNDKDETTLRCQAELRALQRITIGHLFSMFIEEIKAGRNLTIRENNIDTAEIYRQQDKIKSVGADIECPTIKTYYLRRALAKHASSTRYLKPNYTFSEVHPKEKVTPEEFFDGLKKIRLYTASMVMDQLEIQMPLLVQRYNLLTPLYSTINQATNPREELIAGLSTAINVIQRIYQFIHDQFPETQTCPEAFLKKLKSTKFDSFLKKVASLNVFSALPYITTITMTPLEELLTLTEEGILDISIQTQAISDQINVQVLNSTIGYPQSLRERTTGCPALHAKNHSPDKTSFSDFLNAIAASYAEHVLPLPDEQDIVQNF